MAHLHKKIKKGRPYYYVRETRRIKGKSRVVNQVYLGTADRILSVFMGHKQQPRSFSSKEYGSLFVLTEIDREVGLAQLVDEVVPAKRKSTGPSCGELLFYAVLNRAVAPRSKRQLRGWYEKTDIQHLRPVELAALSPQNFWNHWDRIGEDQLERIAERFFHKVQALVESRDEHFLFDTTNYYTYLDSRTASALAKRGRNKAGKHHLRQVGLALVTERATGVPIHYKSYAGNQHESRFFDEHLDAILGKIEEAGGSGELTLIFDKGMNAEGNIQRIDDNDRLHFITSYSPYFAPELACIPLKHFHVLPCRANSKRSDPQDHVLCYETEATFWGRPRRVIITFDPRTFRKKRHDLREKLDKIRTTLYELRRKYRERHPAWKDPKAVEAHYQKLCETLHITSKVFRLSFYTDNGPQMAFALNRYQMESFLRRFAKTILITDHHDWSAEAIHQAYMDRHLLEDQFRRAKNPFHVALMPRYHWTDSKIRIHVFVCVAALTYLTLLELRLAQAGLHLSIRQTMEELRALRTAIYWVADERKPRRMLEEPTDQQIAILEALGYQVKDGWVPQK